MSARVGLVTCLQLPEPDPDQNPLLDAVNQRGVSASWVAWDDPTVSWKDFDLLVIRSTWNYHRNIERFKEWVDSVSALSQLLNPAHVVKANSHKGYLAELAARGVPVTPTEHLKQGQRAELGEICRRKNWKDVVIKPAVSAGSFATMKAESENLTEGQTFLNNMLRERDMMVQPYLTSVEGHGERSIIFIDGEFTHSIRKSPRFAQDRENVSSAIKMEENAVEVAEAVLGPMKQELLYARVDLANDDKGQPLVMELELIEPSLFLLQHPPALERLADGIARRAR